MLHNSINYHQSRQLFLLLKEIGNSTYGEVCLGAAVNLGAASSFLVISAEIVEQNRKI